MPYRFERAAPQAAPKGKIPFIQVGAHRVGDSTFIRAHIEKAHGFDFDAGLERRSSARRPGRSSACWRTISISRSCMRAGWTTRTGTKGPSHFFDGAPEGVPKRARERVRAKLDGHGLGRHRDDEIAELGGRSLDALAALLGDKPYLIGDDALRRRCDRVCHRRRRADAVLRHGAAPARGRPRQSRRLSRPDDAALLPGVRPEGGLGDAGSATRAACRIFATTYGVRMKPCTSPPASLKYPTTTPVSLMLVGVVATASGSSSVLIDPSGFLRKP